MEFRDRIRELRRVPAAELRANPRNWRTHPPAQRAVLRGVLEEIGYAAALVARPTADGGLELIDGHLRADLTPDAPVPVLIVDVNEAEADALLASMDPIGAMAERNETALASLVSDVETSQEAFREFLDELADSNGAGLLDAEPDVEIPETYQIVVECESEDDQRELYERLRQEGRNCRVLTL